MKEIGRVVIANGDFRPNRGTHWTGYKHPVLLLHAPSAQCDRSPYLEAEWVARKNQFALVQMGYPQMDPRPGCGAGSHHVIARLETEVATTVAQWLDGGTAPAGVGDVGPQVAWREQLLHYDVSATMGTHRLEMTLMLPKGTGPFPVAVFNQGDIEMDSGYVRNQSRFVDRIVAREFLQLGWVVAFPARRGVGLSEGVYPLKNFHVNDGDATYKARVHAQDILPAMEYLKTHADLDANRMLVMGQSAGGYSTRHIASMNLPGLIGAVNFSLPREMATLSMTSPSSGARRCGNICQKSMARFAGNESSGICRAIWRCINCARWRRFIGTSRRGLYVDVQGGVA